MLDIIHELARGFDVVIASRFQPGGKAIGVSLHRLFLSNGVSMLLRATIRLPQVRDYSTFYRGYRVELLKTGFDVKSVRPTTWVMFQR